MIPAFAVPSDSSAEKRIAARRVPVERARKRGHHVLPALARLHKSEMLGESARGQLQPESCMRSGLYL